MKAERSSVLEIDVRMNIVTRANLILTSWQLRRIKMKQMRYYALICWNKFQEDFLGPLRHFQPKILY